MFADMFHMKNIMIVTSEPAAHYHFKNFNPDMAKNLTHIVPAVEDVSVKYFNVSSNIDSVSDADLLVVAGGNVTDWCSHVAYIAERYDVPVVFSEIAYIKPFSEEQFNSFDAASVVSKYGEFKLRTYLNDDVLPVHVVGSPMFDVLPEYSPVDGKVLIVSSLFKGDEAYTLRESVKILQEEGYDVVVRPHPGEHADRWSGFKVSHEPDLLKDLSTAQVVVGVPGTAFAVAAAMNVPVVAVEGSTSDYTLEEFKHLFPYVSPGEVKNMVVDVLDGNKNVNVSEDLKKFIIPELGGNMERLVSFWNSQAN